MLEEVVKSNQGHEIFDDLLCEATTYISKENIAAKYRSIMFSQLACKLRQSSGLLAGAVLIPSVS